MRVPDYFHHSFIHPDITRFTFIHSPVILSLIVSNNLLINLISYIFHIVLSLISVTLLSSAYKADNFAIQLDFRILSAV